MTCEITGRPCCMGNEARCEIVSKGVCDFYNGTWHENFTLCSQVSGEKRSLCTPPSPPLRGGGGCARAMENGDILKLFLKRQVHG